MSKLLLTLFLFSTLSASEFDCRPLLCEKVNPCLPGPTGPRGATGPMGKQGEKGDPGKSFSPTFLYAYNNELTSDNTEPTYPCKVYNAGESLLFDHVGKIRGSIEAVSIGGGTTFVFGETGTYEVSVVVYLPSTYPPPPGGASPIPPPNALKYDPNNGSIQAQVNGLTLSSLPPTPGMPEYFLIGQVNGYPIVYQFIHGFKAGQTLTIAPVTYLLVNTMVNSCSIKIVKLF